MFTGIVNGTGIVKSISRAKKKYHDTLMSVYLGSYSRNLRTGDSVSIDGTCLTVTSLRNHTATFEIVGETIERTTFREIEKGDRVNVERSLKLKDRLEGHMVLGHVDGVGEIVEIIKSEEGVKMWIRITDSKMKKYIVPKGSVTVDGISLTVVDVSQNKFSIALVPHTILKTTLGSKIRGQHVNIEYDILSKYIDKLLFYHKQRNYPKISKTYNSTPMQ